MFGYPSATIDRFAPGVEEVYLPAATSLEGELKLELDIDNISTSDPSTQSRSSRIKGLFTKERRTLDRGQIGLDLRVKSPQNWAHAITNHLALSLLIKAMLKDLDAPLVAIFPANISNKILDIFHLSGFLCLATDAPVEGIICKYSLEPWISIRGERCGIIRSGLKDSELVEKLTRTNISEDKIFLSRRTTRTITNEAEVVKYLEQRGFKTIYAEDYSPLEQLAYIVNAREIISVHGAALGPLIIRSAVEGLSNYKLIEIFSPAHVTNVWRLIASQQGASWAGVRGRVWPKLVEPNANFVTNMSSFDVSIDSLESAMSSLEIND